MLTDKRLAEIEESHPKSVSGGDWCNQCRENWPCDAITLVREVKALRKMAKSAEGIGAHLETCFSLEDDGYPCDCGFEELDNALAAWRGGEGEDEG